MASFSERSLQDYETGVTIPYRHMREISRLLGKPVEWFLHGEQTDRLEAIEARVAQLAPAKMVQEGFEALERAIEHLGEQQSPRDDQPASGDSEG